MINAFKRAINCKFETNNNQRKNNNVEIIAMMIL